MILNELKQKLQQPYERNAWQTVLREVFPRIDMYREPNAIHCDHSEVESFLELGNVRLHDDKRLAIFEIALTPKKMIQRNRVELRNLVAKYIDQETSHGVLVIFTGQNEDYRFTFTAKESEFNDDGEFVERQTATKRFTYLLGPHETCTTAARRLSQLAEKQDRATLADVVEAFSVEKLNKEFFNLYKEHYTTFVNHLLAGNVPQLVFGIPRLADEKELDKANKPVRDFAKRLLGRLVFLHFIQKKGWLGCPANRTDWIDGERDFVRNLFLSCPDKEKFYSTRLVPLFFEALNRPDRPNAIFSVTGTRVPYLNGGLFEHEKLPNDHKPLPVEKLDFPAPLFEQLLEFFGQYNFTIDENDPDDHEVGIDPEMLGHIFENLLEDNKDKGAFYTPKAIVQYMCQQSLINYLQQHLGERKEIVNLVRFKDAGSATDKNNWVRQNAKRIEELLDTLKICDPAIGSGAFPIGLLQEIYWIKLTLDWTLDPADTKLKIIQNSIYGVDIDAGAVEIARLRFWLSLIVDEDEPRPLPNLDYKIMQGDSLLESFEGIPLDNLQQAKGFKVEVFSKQGQGQMFPGELLEYTQSQENTARAKEISALINKYFDVTNPTKKQELHKQIDRFVLDHIVYNLQIQEEKISDELTLRKAEIKRKAGLVKGWKPPKKNEQRLAALEEGLKSIALKKEKLQELEEKPERPYFLWHLFFQDVFEQGGFDIVIGNPPYVRADNPDIAQERLAIQNEMRHGEPLYQTLWEKWDLFVPFIELGYRLLRDNGVESMIVSDAYCHSKYAIKSQEWFLKNALVRRLDFLGKLQIFDAGVRNMIFFYERCEGTENEPERRLHTDTFNNVTFLATAPQSELSTRAYFPEDTKQKDFTVSTVRLADICYISVGMVVHADEKQAKGAFELQDLVSEVQDSLHPRPFVEGKHLSRWIATTNKWLEWGTNRAPTLFRRPTFPELYHSEKIFIHRTGGEGIRACFDNKGTVCNHTVLVCVPWHGLQSVRNKSLRKSAVYQDERKTKDDLKPSRHYLEESSRKFNIRFILAVMNSSVARQYLRGDRRSNTDLYPDDWKKLPIPNVSLEHQAPIVTIVDQILTTKHVNPNADISIFEAEVDRLVSALYGLTEEEIAEIEKSQLPQPESIDRKSILFSRILPALKQQSAYFSLAAVKYVLTVAEIELADDTLREYMSEAIASGIVSDAGRGWYSRHTKSVSLAPKPVTKIIREVKKAFPLLDFCCWSTVQFNPFALHLIAQPTIFLYAESDALNSVAETLKESGWDAWADPGKNEVERYIRPGDRTVILRPSIQKQPESKDQVAPIEKALVDLKVEAARLHLMDSTEVQRIIDAVLGSGLLQLTALLGYSEAKREKIESAELAH